MYKEGGIGLIVIGIIVVFYCVFCKKVKKKIMTSNKTIENINNDILQQANKKEAINKDIDQFLKYYNPKENANRIIDLTNLKEEYSKYKELQNNKLAKEIAMQKSNFKRENLKREIELDLSDYYEDINRNFSDMIQDLKINVNEFENVKKKLKKADLEKLRFEKENDTKIFENIKVITESEENIKKEIEKYNHEIDKVVDEKNQIKNQNQMIWL